MTLHILTICTNNVREPIIYEHVVFDLAIRRASDAIVTRCMLAHPSDVPYTDCPVASRWTLLRSTLPE